MVVNNSKTKQLLLLLLLVSTLFFITSAQPMSLPNCPTKCGNVTIPFPFGTTRDCSLNSSFLIDCNQTTSSAFPFLPQTNMTVLDISVNGSLRVEWPVASHCYAKGNPLFNQTIREFDLTTTFYVSSSRNKFTVVSCNADGVLLGDDSQGRSLAAACIALCNSIGDVTSNGSCTGTGCCEASTIPQGLKTIAYGSSSVFNHTRRVDYSPCGYAFLVENGGYSFSSTNLIKFEKTKFPVVLAWEVGNQSCQEAQKEVSSYACKAEHSECYNSTEGSGYFCNCPQGFQGNPYLPQGCQDIDECKESNDCIHETTNCNNFLGSYNCSCPEGFEGDGKRNGTGCSPKSSTNSKRDIILIIALSVSVSVIALLVVSFYVYWTLKKRKHLKLREQFFQQNGGFLLQQQIARHRGSTEMVKVFTVEELKEATNNFDKDKILGQGGQGTVYKGLLQDNRTVAIKKSIIGDPNQIEHFINEVIVLSQINHRNVVKILGCCLETEVPLLVYEFIPNGTVYEHLHDQSHPLKLSWQTRLRIASETAGALSYLHSAASTSIIHRDVKTTNILLDHNLTAKVSDFGASRIVPLDKCQLTTLVQGTLGYLDPEYFHTSYLTEKSDVYSFGVVLAELLTGKKALSFERPEDDRNLAVYFVSSMKEGRLLHIVDTYIIDDAKFEQLMEVAIIAKRCLRVNGEERPTMKEVAMELEGILVIEQHRWESVKNVSSEETENLLKAAPSVLNVEDGVGGSGLSSSGFDSINKMSMSFFGGR